MNILLFSALMMGFAGSVHCIGMCGPLVLIMPFNKFNNFTKWIAVVLYNMGRVISYATIGVIVGILGRSVNWFGITQLLSFILGVVIVFSVIVPRIFYQLKFKIPNSISKYQIRVIQFLVTKNQIYWIWLSGIMNGLLPCGLVYMAVAASLVSGTLTNSILFMTFFGLGTIPTMISVIAISGLLKPTIKNQFKKIAPIITVIIGALLILRGLNLNIPYISPYVSINLSGDTALDCH